MILQYLTAGSRVVEIDRNYLQRKKQQFIVGGFVKINLKNNRLSCVLFLR